MKAHQFVYVGSAIFLSVITYAMIDEKYGNSIVALGLAVALIVGIFWVVKGVFSEVIDAILKLPNHPREGLFPLTWPKISYRLGVLLVGISLFFVIRDEQLHASVDLLKASGLVLGGLIGLRSIAASSFRTAEHEFSLIRRENTD